MPAPTFPTLPGVAYPLTRRPIWSTIHQKAASGRNAPLSMWTYPQRRYELSIDFLRSAAAFGELQSLLGLYQSCRGSALAFQYYDVDDNAVTAQSFGTGNGVQTQFQLVRTFAGFTEPVFAPTGDPVIVRAGTTLTVGTHYTISETGLVTFVTAPGSGLGLTWTGAFNWLCRFDDDSYDFTKILDQVWQTDSITFTTIKGP